MYRDTDTPFAIVIAHSARRMPPKMGDRLSYVNPLDSQNILKYALSNILNLLVQLPFSLAKFGPKLFWGPLNVQIRLSRQIRQTKSQQYSCGFCAAYSKNSHAAYCTYLFVICK